MNHESSFESYLAGRAGEIDVPGAGPAAIAERARVRRRRRRTGSAAVLGAAVLMGGALVGRGLQAEERREEVSSYGAAVGDPTLDWTMVDVSRGLGGTADIARTRSGALYALSTAPGTSRGALSYEPTLYTSVDGSEWQQAALDDGMRVNGLAASGDTLYAVGTGAGGGRLRLATTDSPADGWTVTDLPLDLEAESAGLPGRRYVAESDVDTADGVTVVSVTLGLSVDVDALLAGEEESGDWYPDVDGLVRWVCSTDAGSLASTTAPPSPSTPEAGAESTAVEAAGRSKGDACDETRREVRTWEELGFDPSVGELVIGEVRHYARSEDPATGEAPAFELVDRVPGVYGREVVATEAGFWSIGVARFWSIGVARLDDDHDDSAAAGGVPEVRYSPDGFDWSAPPVALDSAHVTVGVLDGVPHVLTVDWTGGDVLLYRLGAGTASPLDLSDVVGLSEQRFYYGAEIGPLGIAIVSGSPNAYEVLHSLDGSTFGRTRVPLPSPGKKHSVNGVTMTADAVKVRLNVYPAGDTAGGPPEAQQLFVGTPR